MSTPHVAGAAALLWSAVPSLIGKIDETRAILNDGANDVDDTHCGGSADMNNVWGEGKLDILASVDLAPRSAATMTVTVTEKATGKPLAGATARIADTPVSAVTSDSAGRFSPPEVAEGTYTLTAPPAAPAMCNGAYGAALTVDGNETATAELPARFEVLRTAGHHPQPLQEICHGRGRHLVVAGVSVLSVAKRSSRPGRDELPGSSTRKCSSVRWWSSEARFVAGRRRD
ncbi:carboxypeptidase regulatory-like domain-containing protein [Streptomyces sp. NPDC006289]|uniref:carboxypeptidase regulatory-like domain-containing protein n=1 Tax=Streptomyces sp. NPDC006289 TaxID=3156744 RepID=UPI0033BF8FE9